MSGVTPLLKLIISNMPEEKVKTSWMDLNASACEYSQGDYGDKSLSNLDLLLGKSVHKLKSSISTGELWGSNFKGLI